MSIRTTHRALLSRLLPDDKPDDLAVRQGQSHTTVIGSDRVVCLPRTRAAAPRFPERAAALHALAGLDLGFRTPEPLLQGGAHGTDEAPFSWYSAAFLANRWRPTRSTMPKWSTPWRRSTPRCCRAWPVPAPTRPYDQFSLRPQKASGGGSRSASAGRVMTPCRRCA